MLENGKIDVMTAIAYSEERDIIYDFSNETVFFNWGTVYTRSGSTIDSLFDLENKRVAVLANDIYYI
jgi:ABC-type amino acid transport substrate-binding protein